MNTAPFAEARQAVGPQTPSSAFKPLWGNTTKWFSINDLVIAQLGLVLNLDQQDRLGELRGVEEADPVRFRERVRSVLPELNKAELGQVVERATYTIPRVLWHYQNEKCCYCEKPINWKLEADLEHFRPKAAIHNSSDPGYWWLAYDWRNYLLSCKHCNVIKSDQFPLVSGQRAMDTETLETERPILIHPVDEDPEPYFEYESRAPFVKLIGIDGEGRGKQTCDNLTAINQEAQMMARFKELDDLKILALELKKAMARNDSEAIAQTAADLKRQTSSEKPYAGFRRMFFRKLGLGHYL